jgi:hypothetical protein
VTYTDTERRLNGKRGAHKSWAQTENRSARTLPARLGLLAKFERLADPNNELLPAERARRAESLRREHYAAMALKSIESRRRGKAAA